MSGQKRADGATAGWLPTQQDVDCHSHNIEMMDS